MVQWINEFAAGWAEYFGWAVIQNSVFLAIIILLLRVMKDAPARIRYWIGMAGLVKLIIPPFLAAPFLKPSPVLLSSMTVIGIQPVMNVAEGASPQLQLSLSSILFLAWTALLLLFLLWPILASWRMKRLLSDAIPVDHRPIDGVRILKTDRINVPLAFGLFRESIYVPAMWDDWSDDTRRLILAHETAHIRRRDGLGRIFQILVQAIYFFHPMVWYISRKMNEYREMACDDMSTHNEKTLSVEYSRALVQIAERLVRSAVDCPSASALIRQKNELLNRVQYQMEDTMKSISKKRIAIILAGLLALTVPLSWMKAKPAQEEPSLQQEQSKKAEYETQLMSFPEGGIEAIQKNLIYPEAALKAGLEGRVVVQVHTTDKGFKDAEIIESSFEKGKDLGCHQAALDAVRSVRWGKVKGAKEAGGWVNVPFEFRLSPPPSQTPADTTGIVDFFVDEPPQLIEGFDAIQKKVVYPELARKAGVEGRVLLYVQIDENGNVSDTKVIQSLGPDNGCDEAAVEAIKSIKWKPAVYRGKNVAFWIMVPIDFRLGDKKSEETNQSRANDSDKDRQLSKHIEWLIGEINKQYMRPNTEFQGTEKITAIRVQMNESGYLTSVSVHKTCGDPVYDQAAITAVTKVKNQPLESKLDRSEEFIMLVDLGVGGNPDDVKKWNARNYSEPSAR